MNAFLWRGSVLLFLILICLPSSARVGQPLDDRGQPFRFVAQGEYRGQLDAARDSTLHAAQDQLREWLEKQNPPIHRVPSLDAIKRDMLRQENPPQKEKVLSDTMYKVTMEFELTPVQIRSLRSSDRTATGLWILAGITAILGVLIIAARGFALGRTQ